MPKCWLNGELVEEGSATLSIRDSGFLHGAGVFTTMRAYEGKAFALDDHLTRLRQSCQALFVPLQQSNEQIADAVVQLLAENGLREARLRLTVTRGITSQDPVHGMRMSPTALLTAAAIEKYPQEYYEKGMTVLAYDSQRLNPYDLQSGHKTLNYFSRFGALREASGRGAGEAIWFNVHNYLQSGSISNVFLVKNGELHTPPTQAELEDEAIAKATAYPRSNVLPGITRKAVLEQATKNGVRANLRSLTVNDLLEADECFLTNSIMELMPVCRVERKAIGNGRPGDLTRKLSMLYRSAVDQFVRSE